METALLGTTVFLMVWLAFYNLFINFSTPMFWTYFGAAILYAGLTAASIK